MAVSLADLGHEFESITKQPIAFICSDTIIVLIADALTSILAGTIVFGTIGILAKKTGKTFDESVQGGAGLAFIAYPEAVTHFDTGYLPQFFSVLFFTMMLTLGIGSSSGDMGVITGAFYDTFPILNSKKWYKIGTVAAVCSSFFLIGLIFTTQVGFGEFKTLNT